MDNQEAWLRTNNWLANHPYLNFVEELGVTHADHRMVVAGIRGIARCRPEFMSDRSDLFLLSRLGQIDVWRLMHQEHWMEARNLDKGKAESE